MVLERLFRPKAAQAAGKVLYAAAVAQSRRPELYRIPFDAPDTVEGRFELYTLHVVLLLDRLRGQGGEAAAAAQGLFDAYVGALDDALREMGVGDLSVGKKMRKLGEAFYGRVKSYETAFAALPERDLLDALLTRTVYAARVGPPADDLARYILAQRAALAEQPVEGVLEGRPAWTVS